MSECLIQHLNRRVFFDPDTLGIRLPDITGPVQDHHYSEIKAGSDDSHELKNSAVMSTLSINIAQTCNLNCTYCYAGQGTYGNAGKMSASTGRESIDWLVNQGENIREFSINFFGGEPLLRYSTLKDLVSYAEQKKQNGSFLFHYSITTNGSLISQSIIDFFKTYDFAVNVSIDGTRALHNKQRPFLNGEGSYDMVAKNIKKLLAAGVRVSARATIMDQTPEEEIFESLRSLGLEQITVTNASVSRFVSTLPGTGKVNDSGTAADPVKALPLSGQKLQSEADLFYELVGSRRVNELKKLKLSSKLYKNIFSLLSGKKRGRFCGAGQNYAGVSSQGKVYLCHRFVGMDDYQLGTVLSSGSKLKTIGNLAEESVPTVSKCTSCYAKNLCGGGCYHDNLGKTGSIFEQDEKDCKEVRQAAKIAIDLVARLTDQDKDFLEEFNIIVTKFCPLDL